MKELNRLDVQQIRKCLQSEREQTWDVPRLWEQHECQKAAVLVPLMRERDNWHLLFIRRAIHDNDHHSGQVAFAGGKYEPQDENLRSTALREAHEEIGLQPHHVSVLGELGLHYSVSRFQITPVVAHIPWPYDLIPDQSEVARVFSIPLAWLSDPENHHIEQRRLQGQESFPVIYFESYQGEVLWGATARMTLSLVKSLQSGLS